MGWGFDSDELPARVRGHCSRRARGRASSCARGRDCPRRASGAGVVSAHLPDTICELHELAMSRAHHHGGALQESIGRRDPKLDAQLAPTRIRALPCGRRVCLRERRGNADRSSLGRSSCGGSAGCTRSTTGTVEPHGPSRTSLFPSAWALSCLMPDPSQRASRPHRSRTEERWRRPTRRAQKDGLM